MSEPLDEEFLEEFARQQQRRNPAPWRPEGENTCPYCGPGHAWHGLPCRAQGIALPCSCATSYRAAS